MTCSAYILMVWNTSAWMLAVHWLAWLGEIIHGVFMPTGWGAVCVVCDFLEIRIRWLWWRFGNAWNQSSEMGHPDNCLNRRSIGLIFTLLQPLLTGADGDYMPTVHVKDIWHPVRGGWVEGNGMWTDLCDNFKWGKLPESQIAHSLSEIHWQWR